MTTKEIIDLPLDKKVSYIKDNKLRPWEILGLFKQDEDPGETDPLFFYNHFIKPMIPDTLKIMMNGLTINQKAVEDLRTTLDEVLDQVEATLASN